MSWLPDIIAKLVRIGGAEAISRRALNFIAGAGVTLTTSDDEANNATNLTISASGGSSLPSPTGNALEILRVKGDESGYETVPPGSIVSIPVTSVFGRTGDVVPISSDYSSFSLTSFAGRGPGAITPLAADYQSLLFSATPFTTNTVVNTQTNLTTTSVGVIGHHVGTLAFFITTRWNTWTCTYTVAAAKVLVIDFPFAYTGSFPSAADCLIAGDLIVSGGTAGLHELIPASSATIFGSSPNWTLRLTWNFPAPFTALAAGDSVLSARIHIRDNS